MDKIQDPTDDPWVDMITGVADPFDGWRPQLGVFPVRLAGPKERKERQSAIQLRQLEQSLFTSSDWNEVTAKSKYDVFGVQSTRAKLLAVHEERVTEW